MGENSKIEWTHHTFNPWRGCTKVSAGCTNCYAEKMSHRNPAVLGEWGPGARRVLASESMWRQPLKWNRDAQEAGQRRRVFCASLADVFDAEVPAEWRERLFLLILQTQGWLDWLLLTKRPENILPFYSAHFSGPLPFNVWLGVSVESQEQIHRIAAILRVPASVHFVSAEPLLTPLDLSAVRHGSDPDLPMYPDWVIVGGESGPHARPCKVKWVRSVVAQCRAASVPVFVKQLGAKALSEEGCGDCDPCIAGQPCPYASTEFWLDLNDRKGGDWNEWPADLHIREFPHIEATR